MGETRDSNSGDLARALTDLGVEVRRMSQLPDDLDTIAEAITAALGRVDLVITSGGLGPTPDDLTREGIAQALTERPRSIRSWRPGCGNSGPSVACPSRTSISSRRG